jgi:rhodanese-related sulfurtransferase/SAM-dependent methyltransferase
MPDDSAVDALLEAARRRLDRVHPTDLAREIDGGALVVDTRPVDQRRRDGELPDAIVVDRNVLEWRLDPSCPHHLPEVTDAGQRIILVCNEGYSSSLAAATLRDLGLYRATDLIGGFQAWSRLTGGAGHAQRQTHMPDQTAATSDERWLASMLLFVREHLPPAAAGPVVEIGCGPIGGFVPALRSDGYEAVGIDPQAPEGPEYQRTEFEHADAGEPAAAVVASVSLHHVADLDDVVERIASTLAPTGVLVVVEWAWELFDEQTARWCFARLRSEEPSEHPGWLRRHRDDWSASGQPWDSYLAGWAEHESLHRGEAIVQALQARFDTRLLATGPYFYADLVGTTENDERAAIDAGQIRPTSIRYVGQPRADGAQR